jgi:release factor glutamine methyltransferase
MLKKYLRKISAKLLYPIFRRYQRKERLWKQGDITVKVYPGVFHPGLFFSTRFLMEYLSTLELHHKTVHELRKEVKSLKKALNNSSVNS